MHNNYHFLKPLTRELEEWIRGNVISECYSQDKNELLIATRQGNFIRAHLDPSFSCLSFPRDHRRARKNSVNLFPEITGRTVEKVHLHSNERAFTLVLSGSFSLIFKLFGNRSNILLFHAGNLVSIFRTSLKQDYEITPEGLERPIDFSFAAFQDADTDPVKFCPTLGRQVRDYLYDHGYGTLSTEEKYDRLCKFIEELSNAPFYIIEKNEKLSLSLYEDGNVRSAHDSAMVALNEFYLACIREGQLKSEMKRALDTIGREIEKAIRYLDKSSEKLKTLTHEGKYQQLADVVMANLHVFGGGIRSAVLHDFYNDNRPVNVQLKPGMSPQKYAEQLYRKAKNQHIQVENLERNIREKQNELAILEEKLEAVRKAENVKQLREITGKPDRPGKPTESRPYRSVTIEGFEVWIGKNAKSNDAMLRLCHKDDLWLHAKDVAGSHVIIRKRPGSGVPPGVKERAAEIAAYYSKRKQDTLCPVMITLRKYVRKRKGDPAGMVRVDREQEVLLVTPRA